MSAISLNAGIRANLLTLQSVADARSQTQVRLGTGKKVNSPIDNPDAFFTSSNLSTRAGELTARLDGVAGGVKTLKAASTGIAAMRDLLDQARGVALEARALPTPEADAERMASARMFNRLLTQSDTVAEDASYDGVRMLMNDSLVIEFGGTSGTSTAHLPGFDATSAGPVVVASPQTPAAWTGDNTAIDQTIERIKTSINNLDTQTGVLETNLSILTARRTFTEDLIGTLNTGAAELVNADIQEETAAQLANNSRQEFATNAMILAAQSTKQVLQLMG
ncbi:MAG: hypothetical protein IPL39_21340 [Opitutaceae bacterium]|nr:hypothetical protein [Opitutaceae bacterium]